MKRYRVLAIDFDTRALLLAEEIRDEWEPRIREQHLDNKRRVKEGLLAEYGTSDGFRKIADFTDLGPARFSVMAFHNKFLRQVRQSFVIGAYRRPSRRPAG